MKQKKEKTSTATDATTVTKSSSRASRGPTPGLVLAWSGSKDLGNDRAPLIRPTTVGRSSNADWCLLDRRLSRKHFAVEPGDECFVVRDRESSNGTFVDGQKLEGAREVQAGAVVRAGECLFVIVPEIETLAPPSRSAPPLFGISGRFYASSMVEDLRIAARTGRGVLLAGETGTGKELCADAIQAILEELGVEGTLEKHNAAHFAGEDDAVATLFGVTPGAFTNVARRTGTRDQGQSPLAHRVPPPLEHPPTKAVVTRYSTKRSSGVVA